MKRREGGATVVRLEGARVFADSVPFDLELRGGEVLGLTGLIGAGKSELLGALFGLRPLAGGTILLDGEALAPGNPAEAIGRGVHLVPEDRAGQSLIPLWSVRANATLAVLKRFVRRGLTRVRDEQRGTEGMIERLGVVCSGPEAPIESLSGGNQQKVALGRWLFKPARVLLLDEPFRGVDLGARRDIAGRLRELEGDGAVVVASADVDEVLEVADRIVVLAEGSVVQDVRAGRRRPRRAHPGHERSRVSEAAAPAPPEVKLGGRREIDRVILRSGLLVLFALVTLYFAATEPTFRSFDNIVSILQSVSTVGIIALGVTVSMIIGGFDLSIGANAGFTVMLCAICLVLLGLPTVAVVPIALAGGLLIGALNGLLVVRLRVPDLLATLGMLFVLQGAQLLPSRGQSISTGVVLGGQEYTGIFTDAFLYIGRGRIGGEIPVPIVLFAFVGHRALDRAASARAGAGCSTRSAATPRPRGSRACASTGCGWPPT